MDFFKKKKKRGGGGGVCVQTAKVQIYHIIDKRQTV